MSWPKPAPPLDEVVERSGIPYPNGHPYSHITFTMVVWNDAQRAQKLLEKVRPYFENIIVGVQESPDDTLAVAREYADVVVEDDHHGYGDATYGPLVLPRVRTDWALKLDADEWPTDDLLNSLSNCTWWTQHGAKRRGAWIPFRSWVDGIEWEERHSHLRLFHAYVGWPDTLHSQPPIANGILWSHGHILHERSLDEMIRDYLTYLDVGKDQAAWVEHNEMMIRNACIGTAEKKGWEYVKSHEWWSQAEAIVERES